MRRFHSYGPVDRSLHFCAERRELITRYSDTLIGSPGIGGELMSLCGPGQSGKTWLMQEVRKRLAAEYGDRFRIAAFSMQGLIMSSQDPDDVFFSYLPGLFRNGLGSEIPPVRDWNGFTDLFSAQGGLTDKPLILFIDEFDTLPPRIKARLLRIFSAIRGDRKNYRLHSLALTGIYGVMCPEIPHITPVSAFRIMRLPNLTREEVREMFEAYQAESGQSVAPAVIDHICEVTCGHAGLVSWFGELLTETFNPGKGVPIRAEDWQKTYARACTTEWNSTVMFLLEQVRGVFLVNITDLFTHTGIPFNPDADWCNFACLHGIIDHMTPSGPAGEIPHEICTFQSSFIRQRLFTARADILTEAALRQDLVLDPTDDLSDIFDTPALNIPGIISRYGIYLKKIKTGGNRSGADAIDIFHFYGWLNSAVGAYCTVTPEFPEGTGRTVLRIRCGEKEGVIEVISFTSVRQIRQDAQQAAIYARATGLDTVTLALLTPFNDSRILESLSREKIINGVHVTVIAVG
ncbi:hypothetical protein DENIS_1687 [Desulfonema ishimotonii]|uniref:Uncharacterized protein n=1 Tax=Desulfonema ishimotonii TaxID=45657 RepID=A0A401FUV1_9BACT|nr:ATP-binding protein [Desulfonema ishimotonii]GBC60728.1 hypothetical protein DENIS_1687 [Desulfonema ishimotonii]